MGRKIYRIKNIVLYLCLFITGSFSLKGQFHSSNSSNLGALKNDAIIFNYIPFDNYGLEPITIELYEDTIFVYKMVILDREKEDFKDIICQKIFNKDTIDLIKEFIRVFIIEKTEKIILKEPDYKLYGIYTIVHIDVYIHGEKLYKEQIVMYPQREYNSKFLELCNLFFSILRWFR
jgi:hypothetical protein